MAYEYGSLQNNLPTSVTPGWNDPPNLANAAPSSAANRLKQMRARPVHPSITGPSYGMGGYGQASPQQNPYAAPQTYPQAGGQGYPAQNNPGQPINTQPYPQQAQQYPSSQPAPGQYSPSALAQQPQQQFFSTGPSPSPVQISPSMNQSQQGQYSPSAVQQQSYPHQSQYQQPTQQYGAMQGPGYGGQPSQPVSQPTASYPAYPSANNTAYYPDQPTPQMPSGHHRAIYDAFVVSSGPQTSMKQEDIVLRPQTSAAPTPSSSAAYGHPAIQPQMIRSSSLSIPSVSTQPIESDPQSVFFAPPNAMPLPNEETESIPNIFGNRPLVKPAGDVSLPGPQLVAFLYKATARLPPAKCEGVRLKLQQLKDFVDEGRLSEPCLQKLNYLVDAIDRSLFVDALMYFEQLQAQFPAELGHWIQGLRLLLHELRGTARIGSAGAYIRNQ